MFVFSTSCVNSGLLLGQLPIGAEPLSGNRQGFWSFLTNSVFVSAIVTGLILWFVRRAMAKRALVPDGKQNFVEYLVEALYKQIESVVGKRIAPKVFPLLASIFIFILTANWFGLLPGVGTFGMGPKSGFLTIAEQHHGGGGEAGAAVAEAGHGAATGAFDHFIPLLRPATADLNMTVALALLFMVFWVWLTLSEAGLWHFLKHTFGPKGGVKGLLGLFLAVIFFGVGIIEVISIAIRPVSLSLRLYGNIFAGENLLHAMAGLGEMLHFPPVLAFLVKCLLPVPFLFLELLVGAVQALVFMLLCSVYIQLAVPSEEEAHH
jgi:F-type H+-transporting ATPase subunit a